MNQLSLTTLGWRPFFQQQLTFEELESTTPARIVEHHRSEFQLLTEDSAITIPNNPNYPSLTVGDWVLLDENQRIVKLLERRSAFSRKASGSKVEAQLITANVDTAFIVTSLNHDFNLSRLERFLSLVNDADVEPVIVLTKSDLCDDTESYLQQIRKLDPMLMVEAVNALDPEDVKVLQHWCKPGQTITFLGSSGVGKSTLFNTLFGNEVQETNSIREDDSKGRHTTTSRSLKLSENGGLFLDTPGMRELQLADCEQGVETTFADVTQLAEECRFYDCSHNGEPGCAIGKALESGELDERRWNSYQKLMREQAFNASSIAEKRASMKEFGKMIKSVVADKKARTRR